MKKNMKEKIRKEHCNVYNRMSNKITFPPLFLCLPTSKRLGGKHEKEQRGCQRWLPLAPGLASDPLCLAQDACDLLVGVRIAVCSDVTIY